MRTFISYVPLVALLVSAVPVAETEKRQNADFDYVIIGVGSYHQLRRHAR